jgi:hypothetical protein
MFSILRCCGKNWAEILQLADSEEDFCHVELSKNIRLAETLDIAGYSVLRPRSVAWKAAECESFGQSIITRLLSAPQDAKLHKGR